ncbi:MAG: WecB/TagA/CpsF family glycosyltransferase [Rhodocyclaceae bacterium]|nr:MAG: WecB/TagA/CpsF family glycosyltransferase [Rhodocyclaceae bacterium]
MTDFTRDVHCLCGLTVDAVTQEEVVARLRQAAASRTRCFLSTPNLSFLVGSLEDAAFRRSVINSDLSTADGMPLVWIARLMGVPLKERVTGSNVFEALRQGPGRLSVYFFGGPPGAAEQASRRLNQAAAGLVCVGHDFPGFGSIEDMSSDGIIDRINASGADFVVVALGAKKGQAWIERNRDRIRAPLVSHLGAVVNFAAGTVRRAPRWMQCCGLEWLWRIREEPSLWRRYWIDGGRLIGLLWRRVLPAAWYLRRHRPSAVALAEASVGCVEEHGRMVIRPLGAWSAANLLPLRQCFAAAALDGRPVRLDLGGVSFADSAFVGLLLLLHGALAECGRLAVTNPSYPVRRILGYACADFVLEHTA